MSAVILIASITTVFVLIFATATYVTNVQKIQTFEKASNSSLQDVAHQINNNQYRNFEIDRQQQEKLNYNMDKLTVFEEKYSNDTRTLNTNINDFKFNYNKDLKDLRATDADIKKLQDKNISHVKDIQGKVSLIPMHTLNIQDMQNTLASHGNSIQTARQQINTDTMYFKDRISEIQRIDQNQNEKIAGFNTSYTQLNQKISNEENKNKSQDTVISSFNTQLQNINNVRTQTQNTINDLTKFKHETVPNTYVPKTTFDSQFNKYFPDGNSLRLQTQGNDPSKKAMEVINGQNVIMSMNYDGQAKMGTGVGQLHANYERVNIYHGNDINNGFTLHAKDPQGNVGIQTNSVFSIKGLNGQPTFTHNPITGVTQSKQILANQLCVGNKCVEENNFALRGATGEKGPIGPIGPKGDAGPKGDKGPIGLRGPEGSAKNINADFYMRDFGLYLRNNNDRNNKLQWSQDVDGPVLQGLAGGKLSTTKGDNLLWNDSGMIETQGIRFTRNVTNYADTATDKAEISNDTSTFKSLVLTGNRASGAKRVTVANNLNVTGDVDVGARGIFKTDLCINGTCVNENTLKQMIAVSNSQPINIIRSTMMNSIMIASYHHTLVIDTNGKVHSCGYNSHGQLGNNTRNQTNAFGSVESSGSIANKVILAVACIHEHSLGLDSEGKVHAWGNNDYGQLGTGNYNTSYLPLSLSTSGSLNGVTIVAITCGHYHSMALDSNGQIHAWGHNGHSQLGDNTTSSTPTPKVINGGSLAGRTVVAIAANYIQSMALDSTGQVHVWGYNHNGILANSSNTRLPFNISSQGSLSNKQIVSIACGHVHMLALDSNGQIHAWGNGSYGKLGINNSSSTIDTPTIISHGSLVGKKVIAISAGVHHSMALDSSNQIHAWGYNGNGELGNGSFASSSVPITVALSNNKVAVAILVGYYSSFAIDSTGKLHSWGYNGNGQLGTNGNQSRAQEVSTGSLSGKTLMMP